MKTRTKQFIQHLSHEIENEELAESFLDESLPLLGLVLMFFNSLEGTISSMLCEIFSDRSDTLGLIVIQNLTFTGKLDLFKRLGHDFNLHWGSPPANFDELIAELTEVCKLRNLVVHADWNSTDDEGYTFVKLRSTKGEMQQEYVQFSVDSLERVVERINKATSALYDYWEWRSDCVSGHGKGDAP